jgi:hypothetical protein
VEWRTADGKKMIAHFMALTYFVTWIVVGGEKSWTDDVLLDMVDKPIHSLFRGGWC